MDATTGAQAAGPGARGTGGARPSRRVAPLVGWLGLLGAALGGLHALGAGPLAAPALSEPHTWSGWAATREPVLVAFAMARLVTLALAWYLAAVTLLGLAARLVGAARVVRVADVVTVPALRRLLHGALGVGLAAAALTSVGQTVSAPTVLSAVLVEPPGADAAADAVTGPARPERAGPALPADTPAALGPPDRRAHEPGAEDGEAEWTVRAGEHFWRAAERTLATAWGRSPTATETLPYWRELVALNEAELVDAGNPDLVVPGQVFRVPPEPPKPS